MTKVKVDTHDGISFIEEVENYNAKEMNDIINSSDVLTVLIGERIISRIKIADISIVE